MSDKVKITGIIGIIIIVIGALISTDFITMAAGTDAAIDISFVLSGIAGIVTLATRPTPNKTPPKE